MTLTPTQKAELVLHEAPGPDTRWVLAIDHREVRILRSLSPRTSGEYLLPNPSGGPLQHAHHSKEFSMGRETLQEDRYFAPVAAVLRDAKQILLLGCVTGSAHETEPFVAWLKGQHPEVAAHISGPLTLPDEPQTDAQLMDAAREFYTRHPVQMPLVF